MDENTKLVALSTEALRHADMVSQNFEISFKEGTPVRFTGEVQKIPWESPDGDENFPNNHDNGATKWEILWEAEKEKKYPQGRELQQSR